MVLKAIFLQLIQHLKAFFGDDGLYTREQKNIMLLKTGRFIIVGLAYIIGILAVFLSTKIDYNYLYGLLLSLVLIFCGSRLNGRLNILKRLDEAKQNWGKEIKKERDFSVVTDFFNKMKKNEEFYIDDRTWQDLNMDAIYEKIDRTQTIVGEQYLYHLLRKPEFKLSTLEKRNKKIKNILSDKDFRENLQMILNSIGREGGEGIVSFIWDKLPSLSKRSWIYKVLFILTLVAIGASVVKPFLIVFFLVPMMGINMFVHFHEKKRYFEYLISLFNLGRLLDSAKKLAKTNFNNPEFIKYQQELKAALKPVRKIARKTAVFQFKNDPLMEYPFIMFLTEVRTFYNILDTIKRNQDALQQIYMIIGELDAFVSIASFRAGLTYYSEPELSSGLSDLEVEDIYHPLLSDPISNSFKLKESGMLITGSNMSGKSTMLRSVGVNVLLAQTIFTSLTRKYRANFYKLMTSIGRSDNLISGDSYYLVEAKALLRIINEIEVDVPTFCIVDEIFRGTNSMERIAASAEVLRYLSNQNCRTFAATHDLELTGMLKEGYANYHFREEVSQNGLHFDYQLRTGPFHNSKCDTTVGVFGVS